MHANAELELSYIISQLIGQYSILELVHTVHTIFGKAAHDGGVVRVGIRQAADCDVLS